MLICLKIPCVCVWVGGRWAESIPQTCGPLGAPCFLSGHMVLLTLTIKAWNGEYRKQKTQTASHTAATHPSRAPGTQLGGEVGLLIYFLFGHTVLCVGS